ncbi:MAG: R3H domain-containing nucleic acid-binding protein [Thermomicrobiales bacterium]
MSDSVEHSSQPPNQRRQYEHEVTDNLEDLLSVLPPHIEAALTELGNRDALLEIVLDLGRRPEARYEGDEITLGDAEVTRDDLAYVAERIGQFGGDNRAGIERTLHRISAIRNRKGEIVGLTCRIGRAVYGTIAILRDLVESGESILMLGRPGVGKTTMLREAARVLADEFRKRVVIVDTSNEIAGDGDIPHPSIGRARRMQVPTPTAQHGVMIEAVENHMPEVIVIDEIGTELEAGAARTIAERGVQLIGTAHGNTLENLMLNPTLSDLIGGIQSVTLSDEEARRRGTQKSILERKAPPTFSVMVELRERDQVAVYHDVAAMVDATLRNQTVEPEVRKRLDDGGYEILSSAARFGATQRRERENASGRGQWNERRSQSPVLLPERLTGRNAQRVVETVSPMERLSGIAPTGAFGGRVRDQHAAAAYAEPEPVAPERRVPVVHELRDPVRRGRGTEEKPLRIYPFGVSRNRLEEAIRSVRVAAVIVRAIKEADAVMTLKNYYRRRPQPLVEAEMNGTPVYVLRSNTQQQMESVLANVFEVSRSAPEPEKPSDPQLQAMEEAEAAISSVLDNVESVELRPQSSYIRRLQHQMAERYNLGSRSRGQGADRRVEIFRSAD